MTSKEKACEVISRMPEESTFEDIQYHLYVRQCIERGSEMSRTARRRRMRRRRSDWRNGCGSARGQADTSSGLAIAKLRPFDFAQGEL